jgi:serine/threonine protein phosphatase PrpC
LDDHLFNRINRFLRSKPAARASESFGDYAVTTSVGLVREQNQDAALIVIARYASSPDRDFNLAIVCDGLGGMKHGAEASALGLSAFVSKFARLSRAPAEERVFSAISQANSEIYNALHGEGGTTLSAVLIQRTGAAIICHVGDSRVYAIGKTTARQLTQDDTLQAALNKRPEQSHRQRDTRLLQFVGMGADLEAQLFAHTSPDTQAYLLTSDGAHDVPSDLLQRAIHAARNNTELTRKLIQLSEILGGLDNATAIALPASLSGEVERPSEGLDLLLLAPNGRLSVWIPQLVDERRAQFAAPVQAAASSEAAVRDSSGGQNGTEGHGTAENAVDPEQGSPGKSRRMRSKSSKKKKKAIATDELPLSESLTIQFPKSQGN